MNRLSLSIVIVGMLFAVTAFAQPSLVWSSPIGTDSTIYGWVYLSENPNVVRFYQITSASIRIMSSATSSTSSLSIPITADEWSYYQEYPYLSVYDDMSGDRQFDLVVTSQYTTTTPYRYGFRIVNTATGANVLILNASNTSYYLSAVDDIDNDGYTDLMVAAYNYLITTNQYNMLLYSTQGRTTAVSDPSSRHPSGFQMHSNYPNPFNSSTTMRYHVDRPGSAKVSIYDNQGRTVRTMNLSNPAGGEREAVWDGTTNSGQAVGSGTYYYQIDVNGERITDKMQLVK